MKEGSCAKHTRVGSPLCSPLSSSCSSSSSVCVCLYVCVSVCVCLCVCVYSLWPLSSFSLPHSLYVVFLLSLLFFFVFRYLGVFCLVFFLFLFKETACRSEAHRACCVSRHYIFSLSLSASFSLFLSACMLYFLSLFPFSPGVVATAHRIRAASGSKQPIHVDVLCFLLCVFPCV